MRAILVIIPLLTSSTAAFLPSHHRPPRFGLSLAAARGGTGRGSRAPPVKEVRPAMNDEISADQLRVVAPNPSGKDEPLGIMSRAEALQKAQELGGLDLILVNDKSDPPVCKICDYSKYRYMQEKKAKEVKKKSKATEIKEVKMSYKIDVHDYDVRRKNAAKFLRAGNRVKCTVMFRGREVQHDQLGVQLLEKLSQDLEDVCLREGRAKREGRNLSLILSPRPEVLKAVSDSRKSADKAKKQQRAEAFKKRQEAEQNGTLSALDMQDDDDDDDDDDYEDDDDDDDDDTSLEDLLGGDDLTDDLFN